MQGLALVGAVNCEEKENAKICVRHQVKGYPTIKVSPVCSATHVSKFQGAL